MVVGVLIRRVKSTVPIGRVQTMLIMNFSENTALKTLCLKAEFVTRKLVQEEIQVAFTLQMLQIHALLLQCFIPCVHVMHA